LDDEQHHVAFDGGNTWLCSEPRVLEVLTNRGLEDKLNGFLKEHDQPLGERLPSLVAEMHEAERRGRQKAELRRGSGMPQDTSISDRGDIPVVETLTRRSIVEGESDAASTPEPEPPVSREPKPLGSEAAALRQVADIAAHVFEAQLIIVQPR
jgi:hypothetical protein